MGPREVCTQRHHAYQPPRKGEITQEIAMQLGEVVEWGVEGALRGGCISDGKQQSGIEVHTIWGGVFA